MLPPINIVIITVVLNDCEGLENTIKSIIGQTYSNMEFIVIDGGSTDGTLQTIKQYKKYIDVWESNIDKGIYDAMNKGIEKSSGGYICFMNAGDLFYSVDVVERVALNLAEQPAGILYGNVEVVYQDGFKRISAARDLSDLWKGMCFCHQSFFIDAGIAKKKFYNFKNSLNADYEMICDLFKGGVKFKYFDGIISSVTAGGVSDTKRINSVIGQWKISRYIWPFFKTDLYFSLKLIDSFFRQTFHKLLPGSIRMYLIKLKYFLKDIR